MLRWLSNVFWPTPRYKGEEQFSKLPHEVLLKILSNLSPAELTRFMRTCRTLKWTGDDPVLWRDYYMDRLWVGHVPTFPEQAPYKALYRLQHAFERKLHKTKDLQSQALPRCHMLITPHGCLMTNVPMTPEEAATKERLEKELALLKTSLQTVNPKRKR